MVEVSFAFYLLWENIEKYWYVIFHEFIKLFEKVRKTVSARKMLKIQVYYDQINIEVHYTEAIRKRQFRITQGDINTVQEKDIHAILPCPVLRRGVYGFKKDVDADLF